MSPYESRPERRIDISSPASSSISDTPHSPSLRAVPFPYWLNRILLDLFSMDLSCLLHSFTYHQFPSTQACLLPLLSKFIGYSIIATSTVCKIPQIYLILKNRSIRGLSTASFELEVVGFTIALAYCVFKDLPFSAYGELVFLLLQSIIQVGLMYYYSAEGALTWLKAGIYCAVAPYLLAGQLDPMLFEALYASQHVIFLVSKIPQIAENFQNKSTGQLSFTTNLLNFGGCFARLFTSVQEKAPVSMILGSILGIITNGIVMYQLLFYGGSETA